MVQNRFGSDSKFYDFNKRPASVDALCGHYDIHVGDLFSTHANDLQFIIDAVKECELYANEALELFRYVYDTVDIGMTSIDQEVFDYYQEKYEELFMEDCWEIISKMELATTYGVEYEPTKKVFVIDGVEINDVVFMTTIQHGEPIQDTDGNYYIASVRRMSVDEELFSTGLVKM